MARVLVVDDDEMMRDMLEDVLQEAGHDVILAEDGEQGVSRFREQPVDLVITDILMPRKGGLNMIQELRDLAPDLRVIAISGGGKDGKLNFLSTAKTFPGVITLNKPFGHREILETVREALS